MKKNLRNKKSITIFGALIFILPSCNSSVETDAEKMAEMQCKSYEFLEKAGKGEAEFSECAKFAAEVELVEKEMNEKYSSKEEKQKFEEECLKATAKACD